MLRGERALTSTPSQQCIRRVSAVAGVNNQNSNEKLRFLFCSGSPTTNCTDYAKRRGPRLRAANSSVRHYLDAQATRGSRPPRGQSLRTLAFTASAASPYTFHTSNEGNIAFSRCALPSPPRAYGGVLPPAGARSRVARCSAPSQPSRDLPSVRRSARAPFFLRSAERRGHTGSRQRNRSCASDPTLLLATHRERAPRP